MYVQRNIEALSLNHCCSGKAINITYYESVFKALGIHLLMQTIPLCDNMEVYIGCIYIYIYIYLYIYLFIYV